MINENRAIFELKKLISSQGYIYSLCLILFEDFHHNLDEIHKVDYRSKLSVKECSLIIGFLVQNDLNFTFPNSPEEVIYLKDRTYEIMHELQFSFISSQGIEMRDLIEKQPKDLEINDSREDSIDFFVKSGAMVESMFYAGDGVYDFQYLEYLERKYKYDKNWLLRNRNFDIEDVIEIVKKSKSILLEKSKKVKLLDLRNTFPKHALKARKKMKKQFSKEKIDEFEQQSLITATFHQYRELFPPASGRSGASVGDWEIFYNNLISLFTVSISEYDNNLNCKSFFRNFSFIPNCNHSYKGPGYFNILNSKPLIKISENRFFIPIGYLVTEAVYESPFYWMFEDKSYKNQLSEHRRVVGEEIAFELLSKVFGKDNTFKSVLATTRKGQPDTDVDVLCVLGNKALCVQVKSKKLTLNAKRGDFEQLSKDFKGSIQDAYDQGLIFKKALFDSKARFTNENGNELFFKDKIEEVYILSITTENYPSLVHQVHVMLIKKDEEPYPLVITVFDLELLVHYLPDPYDFFYYVRQRVDLIDYFLAVEEIVYLGYHLDKKLCKIDGYDKIMLDPIFGAHIDRNYYPFKMGMSHLLNKKNDRIHNSWKDLQFDNFVNKIKNSSHPYKLDIIFDLLDWSGETRKNIINQVIQTKSKSKNEQQNKSIATSNAPHFGFSYIVINSVNPRELEDKVIVYSTFKKYQLKCDKWLGIGSFATSNDMIDFMIYLNEPWIFDNELELESNEFFNNSGGGIIPLGKNKKIGRNDPCPCKSGLKYKKCCAAF